MEGFGLALRTRNTTGSFDLLWKRVESIWCFWMNKVELASCWLSWCYGGHERMDREFQSVRMVSKIRRSEGYWLTFQYAQSISFLPNSES